MRTTGRGLSRDDSGPPRNRHASPPRTRHHGHDRPIGGAAMIARIWSGRATPENAGHYQRHFTDDVAPQLQEIPGSQGAYLLRRETGGQVEFVAVTLWDSLETVTQFTGPDPSVAIVEPAARAVLTHLGAGARHYEVVPRPP